MIRAWIRLRLTISWRKMKFVEILMAKLRIKKNSSITIYELKVRRGSREDLILMKKRLMISLDSFRRKIRLIFSIGQEKTMCLLWSQNTSVQPQIFPLMRSQSIKLIFRGERFLLHLCLLGRHLFLNLAAHLKS